MVFFTLATYLGTKSFVGSYGKSLALFNLHYFGYLAYVYPILLLWPLYRFYKDSRPTLRRVEQVLSSLLLFFAALIFQALVIESPYHGHIGNSIALFLTPLIGYAGVWLFLILLISMALFILLDIDPEKISDFMHRLTQRIRKNTEIEPDPPIENTPHRETTSTSRRYIDDDEMVDELEHDRYEGEFSKRNDIEIPDDGYDSKVRLVKKEEALKEEAPAKHATTSVPTPEPARGQQPATSETKPAEMPPEESAPTIETPSPPAKTEKSHAIIVHELEENKKLMEQVEQGGTEKPKDFSLPPTNIFQPPKSGGVKMDENEIDKKIEDLLDKLHRFKIDGDVVRTYSGPVVTTFELRPAPHIKVSKILNLEDDLAMALRAKTIRIQAPVPGKDVVGIEIPNNSVDTIYFREVVESEIFQKASSPLTLALGKDIVGKPFITDLKKLPHLLIAGTTGSGKSVGINGMILSLLYKNSPEKLKLMLIDPKMLEFSIYNDIPHLLTPVITEPKKAITALGNMVAEMEKRNKFMSQARVKNIEGYNDKAKKEGFDPFPYIVVIIDELADLMMTAGKDVEYYIARLAQMARASGIHLIVATQRPSVDVVTGLIKANLPSRLSYKVGQKVDSKVILDQYGAETLLGRGDMLFTPPGITGLVRLHAPWSTEEEIETVAEFLKGQRDPDYDENFLSEESSGGGSGLDPDDKDDLFEDAKQIVLTERKTSISYIQRRLQIGYNRAARIVEQLESAKVLTQADHKGNREIIN